jgi:hypothetical protein
MTTRVNNYPTMTAIAREQLSEFDWEDKCEIGGGLYGHRENGHLVVTHCMPAPVIEAGPWHIQIDNHFLNLFDREGHRLIGDIHTHCVPGQGHARASQTDRDSWTNAARGLKHDYIGLIVNPRREFPPEPGVPMGLDWAYPKLSAYIATPAGDVTPVRLDVQPRWLADLEAQVRFQPVEHQELAKGIR